MKGIIHFIKNFFNNNGSYFFLSSVVTKIVLFINAVFVIKLISQHEYGTLAYAITVFSFIVPFVGLGSYQGLIRFGPILKTDKERHNLSNYTITIGFINTLFMGVLLIAFAQISTKNFPEARSMIMLLSLRLIGMFLIEQLSTHFRVFNDNKKSAFVEVLTGVTTLFLSVLLTLKYGVTGYFFALLIAPSLAFFIAVAWLKPDYKLQFNFNFDLNLKAFWEYSIVLGITTSISTLIFLLDIFFVGNLITQNASQAVALYKVATLIPMNLLFLPAIFIRTDFVAVAKNYQNKEYLITYYLNFLKLFTFIGVGIITFSFLFGDYLIPLIFGQMYKQTNIFKILIVGSCISMCFRVPLGNITSALGMARQSLIISIITIITDIILNIVFIKAFGLVGAAYATCICMALSGLMSLYVFMNYLKKID